MRNAIFLPLAALVLGVIMNVEPAAAASLWTIRSIWRRRR